jgi:RNA polymerase-binding transcription factor DksA
MKNSRRVMRRAILSNLRAHLQNAYGVDLGEESFVQGHMSIRDIDAVLAFKSDFRIDELRGALDRLERGVFGQCLACKGTIDPESLVADPTIRLCATCERLYGHVMTGERQVSASPVH